MIDRCDKNGHDFQMSTYWKTIKEIVTKTKRFHWPFDISFSLAKWHQLLIGHLKSASHWPFDICFSLAIWHMLLIGQLTSASHWPTDMHHLPLLTEIPSSHQKGLPTDQQTDMCNPTDAIASNNLLMNVRIKDKMSIVLTLTCLSIWLSVGSIFHIFDHILFVSTL